MANSYDVIIIGSGPGGYVTAIRVGPARPEDGAGGEILSRRHLPQLGLHPDQGAAPLGRDLPLHGARQGLRPLGQGRELRPGRGGEALARRRGAALERRRVPDEEEQDRRDLGHGDDHRAPARSSVKAADNPPKGALGAGDYTAKHIIVATGARPRALPGLEPDGKLVWTYFEAMAPDKMPKSLLVVGSGAIGIEFASFYRTLGAEVTVVEILPQILPVEDEEIAAHARKRFEKQGMQILTDAKVAEPQEGQGQRHRHDRD